MKTARPAERPPEFGLTLIAEPINSSAEDLLDRLREAWAVVAGWGRWSDEELGDWPDAQAALAELPEQLRSRLEKEPDFELQNLMDDLHDRDWEWWSGAVVDSKVKVDLNASSLPVSVWPLRSFVEWSGGQVVRYGDWMPDLPAGAGEPG